MQSLRFLRILQGSIRTYSWYTLKASGGWRPVIDLKQLNAHSDAPHFHYKLSTEYRQKSRLCIQNRLAGCVLPCTNTSRQQEVPQVCLRKQGLSVPSTSFRSEHYPSGIYSSSAHSGSLPPSSGDISYSISRRLVNTTLHRPSSITNATSLSY